MPVKKFRPITPSLRFKTVSDFAEITRDYPEKSLVEPLRRTGGRNNQGQVTAWQKGGGHKRAFRRIDFKRDKVGIPAKVVSIEYNSNFQPGERKVMPYQQGYTGAYILTIEGLCSLDARGGSKVSITCKTSATEFKKHYLGVSDNVTYFIEQMDAAPASVFHYRVTFNPSAMVPDIRLAK